MLCSGEWSKWVHLARSQDKISELSNCVFFQLITLIFISVFSTYLQPVSSPALESQQILKVLVIVNNNKCCRIIYKPRSTSQWIYSASQLLSTDTAQLLWIIVKFPSELIDTAKLIHIMTHCLVMWIYHSIHANRAIDRCKWTLLSIILEDKEWKFSLTEKVQCRLCFIDVELFVLSEQRIEIQESFLANQTELLITDDHSQSNCTRKSVF